MTAPSSTSVSPAPGGRRKKSAGLGYAVQGPGLGPAANGQGLGTPVKEGKDKEHHHATGWVRRRRCRRRRIDTSHFNALLFPFTLSICNAIEHLTSSLQKSSTLYLTPLLSPSHHTTPPNLSLQGAGAAIAALLRSPHTVHLHTLHLGWNMIRSQAALDIGHSLAVNKSLRFIDLSFNKLGREGGLALGQALLTNTTLETLNLSYTGLEAQVGA